MQVDSVIGTSGPHALRLDCSERDVIFTDRLELRRAWLLGWLLPPRACRLRSPLLLDAGRAGSATASIRALGIDELEVLDHDFQLRAVAAVLILPLIELEPSLDENRAALRQILADDFRGASPCVAIDKSHLFLHLAILPLV